MDRNTGYSILVVEDVEETRDGIEQLLWADGYTVMPVRDEKAAIVSSRQAPPDLVLIGLGVPVDELIPTTNLIRVRSGLSEAVPVVIFCFEALEEGEEVALEGNIYLTRPDNFNQLRVLLKRLLS
jgi:CheY-like chemotaxis protein